MNLKENLKIVNDKIEEIVKKQNRSREDITLIAVSKTISEDIVNEAIALGIKDLGENKAQEIERKMPLLEGDYDMHMIGSLQTNKVRHLIDKVKMIHSLDRISLAKEINKRAARIDRVMDVLIQVNISGEETKSGFAADEVLGFLKEIEDYENIRIKGLMTMAPHAENPEDIRYVFRDLKKLFEDLKKEDIKNVDMQYLSMGMTNDYHIALEEGSNMIRVGTAIFGERDYSK
ncbi:MAG: YggS family pyridoxal phosphate-dependent enzyme [Andreesenia angusta]|nr:YggS family pyridoxal phosphate-dependent enzyme [Andreesenia angusta]